MASHMASHMACTAPTGMKDCPTPIVFAVTNFDPALPAGQPNFDDVPANAEAGKRWGFFKQLAVRTAQVTAATAPSCGHMVCLTVLRILLGRSLKLVQEGKAPTIVRRVVCLINV